MMPPHQSSLRANPKRLAKQSIDCRVAALLAIAMLGLSHVPVAAANEKNQPKPAATIAPYPATVKTEFLTSCVGLHKEMIPACKCMILTFEKTVPLKDYLAIAKKEDPSQDDRFKKVAGACLRRLQTQTQ